MRTDHRHSTPGRRRTARLPHGVYAILDLGVCARRAMDPASIARKLCGAGVSTLQLRAKEASDREFLAAARAVARICRRAGVTFIVDDRADIATLASAHGVHLGQEDLPPAAVRRIVGPRLVLGLSTHSAAQVRSAMAEPVDYIGVGPVFPTGTKENPDPALGLDRLRRLVRQSALPVAAIGGIRTVDVAQVRRAGAHAAALVSALLDSGDPARNAAASVAEFTRGARRSSNGTPPRSGGPKRPTSGRGA